MTAAIDRYLGGDGEIAETLCERSADPHIGRIEGFGKLERVEQTLRAADERVKDELDVYHTYSCDQAKCEAERCLQCDLRLQFTPVKLWSEYGGAN